MRLVSIHRAARGSPRLNANMNCCFVCYFLPCISIYSHTFPLLLCKELPVFYCFECFFSLPVYCFLVMIIVFALFDCCLLDYCFCSCGLVGLITYLCLPCLPYQLCLCLIYCICLLRDNKPPTFGFYLVSMSSPSG